MNIQELIREFDKLYFSNENEENQNYPIRIINYAGKKLTQEDYIKQKIKELNKSY